MFIIIVFGLPGGSSWIIGVGWLGILSTASGSSDEGR